ncbi:MAG: ATP-dependent DNA helicase [Anaeromyxobacter sp.]|nr:ATP-dependent DNA helicase [Anaeromyxobacter sp.]
MAHAVARALDDRRYLVAEAGTGTGKTLAYLVPAALCGRRVVISTATKALQEQIWWKDLPLLRERCGLHFEAAYLKGRSNYLCLERAAEFARAPTFAVREEAAFWPQLKAWAEVTETGDRAELDLPEQLAAWKDLSATSDTCLGRECPAYEECFVTRARARAAASQVLLVNHHLFFADLAMRTGRAGVEVLPDYDVVIFDEAHALEEVATEYFGLQVSSWRVEELARDAQRVVADRPDLAAMLKELTGELRKSGERFFAGVGEQLRGAGGGRFGGGAGGRGPARPARRARGGGAGAGSGEGAPGLFEAGGEAASARRPGGEEEPARAPLSEAMLAPLGVERDRLDAALQQVRDTLADADAPALAQVARRAAELRIELQAVTALREPTRVYFGETRGRGVFLRAAPIDVAGELNERLYARTDTAVFTSATLAAGGRFDFFRRQVGLGPDLEVEEAVFPGPFDYQRQAALVVPDGLPEPSDPGFVAAAAAAVEALTEVTGGRAFVLCTSNRNMAALHAASSHLPYQRLLQGERPKQRLLELFRAEPSVLFATASFWEGVDVPGQALSLVIIDRLPFAPPGDPIMAARLAAAEAEGRQGFGELQVPAAALALRQGFGRLIRTATDRGLVAVLDRRLLTKGYGRAFLASLPRCPLLRSLEEARAWWAAGA